MNASVLKRISIVGMLVLLGITRRTPTGDRERIETRSVTAVVGGHLVATRSP
jgi:hypothetical protein